MQRFSAEELAERNPVSETFCIKSFFSQYKKFVDLKELAADKETYLKRLAFFESELKNVDFNKNTLFIGGAPVHREVFLTGFGSLGVRKSFFYGSMDEINDIWWGDRRESNTRVQEDEVYNSPQDIRQEVMCLYSGYEISNAKTPEVVACAVSTRSNLGVNSNNKSLTSWVFLRCTKTSFENIPFYKPLRSLFNDSYLKDTYQIIDLTDILDRYRMKFVSTDAKGTPVKMSDTLNSSVSDLY